MAARQAGAFFLLSPRAAVIALLDLAFLPLLIAALYAPLRQAQNHVNRIFLPLLGVTALMLKQASAS